MTNWTGKTRKAEWSIRKNLNRKLCLNKPKFTKVLPINQKCCSFCFIWNTGFNLYYSTLSLSSKKIFLLCQVHAGRCSCMESHLCWFGPKCCQQMQHAGRYHLLTQNSMPHFLSSGKPCPVWHTIWVTIHVRPLEAQWNALYNMTTTMAASAHISAGMQLQQLSGHRLPTTSDWSRPWNRSFVLPFVPSLPTLLNALDVCDESHPLPPSSILPVCWTNHPEPGYDVLCASQHSVSVGT
jgi:hypothetical protein